MNSRAFYERRLLRNIKRCQQLDKNEIKPSKIVGTGLKNPRKIAYEWLHNEIEIGLANLGIK